MQTKNEKAIVSAALRIEPHGFGTPTAEKAGNRWHARDKEGKEVNKAKQDFKTLNGTFTYRHHETPRSNCRHRMEKHSRYRSSTLTCCGGRHRTLTTCSRKPSVPLGPAIKSKNVRCKSCVPNGMIIPSHCAFLVYCNAVGHKFQHFPPTILREAAVCKHGSFSESLHSNFNNQSGFGTKRSLCVVRPMKVPAHLCASL